MSEQRFPTGWDADRVNRLIDHYDNLSEDDQVGEDEAAFQADGITMIAVPSALADEVRTLIARRQTENPPRT